jgi:hypothetical protein
MVGALEATFSLHENAQKMKRKRNKGKWKKKSSKHDLMNRWNPWVAPSWTWLVSRDKVLFVGFNDDNSAIMTYDPGLNK